MKEYINLDRISIDDWSKAHKPQPFVLNYSDAGCGCCSDGDTVYTAADAIEVVEKYIAEHEADIAQWKQWLLKIQDSKEILPFG